MKEQLSEIKAKLKNCKEFTAKFGFEKNLRKDHFWIKTKDGKIGSTLTHYEILFYDKKEFNVEFHFEDIANYKIFKERYKNISIDE